MSMRLRMIRPWLTPLLLCLVLLPAPATPGRGAASSWEVKMTLEVSGEYKMEGTGVRAEGVYSFAFLWTGTMEKDDEDYLLVHGRCDLTKWKIEEKAGQEGSLCTLTAADFPEKPVLKVNYILRLEGGLHVDFAVQGFSVPQTPAPDSFELVLPASYENTARFGGINYDLFVKKGSNKIILDEKDVRRGAALRFFDWTWKRQTWIQGQERTVLQAQAHQAKVKVEITARY